MTKSKKAKAQPIPMSPEEMKAASEHLQQLFAPSRSTPRDPVLDAVRSLTQIINDLSDDNRRLREESTMMRSQIDSLMRSYERMAMTAARLAGIPEELAGGVTEAEIDAFRKSAEQVTAQAKERANEQRDGDSSGHAGEPAESPSPPEAG